MTGTSYNHFNQNDSLWHQTWIDNQGGSLYIQGDVKDGVMTMGTKMIQGKTGKYYNRITWTPMKDGSVIQKWDLLNSKDEVFQTLFIGKYVRKE